MDPDPNNNTKSLMCDKCPLMFCSKDALKNHLKKAHDDRELFCGDCGKVFIGNYNYNQHQRNHKTFQCHKCGHDIPVMNRARHLKLCGNKEGVEKKESLHSCTLCDYKTPDKSNLRKHINRVHKKSSCNVCGKEFSKEDFLKRHMDLAHSSHKCKWDGCNYTSKFFSNTVKHQKICPAAKRLQAPPRKEAIPTSELKDLFLKMDCSLQSFEVLMDWLYEEFGAETFQKGSKIFMREYFKKLGYQHKSEDLEFKDKNGNTITRTFSYVSDLSGFIREAIIGRNVTDPMLLISADKVSKIA